MRMIVAVCDLCHEQGEDASGETVTLALDKTGPLSIDLCKDHRVELVDPLRRLLNQHGTPPAAASQGDAKGSTMPSDSTVRAPCPLCPVERVGAQGIALHLESSHGFKVGPRQGSKLFDVRHCPLCNAGPFMSVGLQHLSSAHPEVAGGIAGLFAAAESKGDPHGIVAANRARLRALISRGASYDEAMAATVSGGATNGQS
jgi:hypothetical protein